MYTVRDVGTKGVHEASRGLCFPPVTTRLSHARCSRVKRSARYRRTLHRSHQLPACQAVSLSFAAASGADSTRLAATLLGYAVLAGSMVRSIPQITRIIRNQSVEGLSLTSFVSELVAYTIITAYNFNLGYPFSSYGEVAACWVQDVVLVYLVLHYRRKMKTSTLAWTLVFVAFTVVVMGNYCGSQVLYGLQASTIVMIALGARIPQIWMNYKRGNSGELSMLTCLMNVAGCFTRMFTTFVLTKDTLNMLGALIQAVLNGILLYQTIKTASRRSSQEAPSIATQDPKHA